MIDDDKLNMWVEFFHILTISNCKTSCKTPHTSLTLVLHVFLFIVQIVLCDNKPSIIASNHNNMESHKVIYSVLGSHFVAII